MRAHKNNLFSVSPISLTSTPVTVNYRHFSSLCSYMNFSKMFRHSAKFVAHIPSATDACIHDAESSFWWGNSVSSADMPSSSLEFLVLNCDSAQFFAAKGRWLVKCLGRTHSIGLFVLEKDVVSWSVLANKNITTVISITIFHTVSLGFFSM